MLRLCKVRNLSCKGIPLLRPRFSYVPKCCLVGRTNKLEELNSILKNDANNQKLENPARLENAWRPNTVDRDLPDPEYPLTASMLSESVPRRKTLLPLDKDIPILPVLEDEKLRNYRFIPYSQNPYATGKKTFDYSITESTRQLIIDTISPLLSTEFTDCVESIPSTSSGLIIFSTPFIGAENYTKQLAMSIASSSQIKADFISIRLSDIFERVPPFRALEGSFRAKESTDDSDETLEKVIFPFSLLNEKLNSMKKGGDSIIITETPFSHSSSSPSSSSSSNKFKRHDYTDSTDVPFPWARRYFQGKNPLLIPRYHGLSSSNISNLITSKLYKIINTITLLEPSENRKIIFFEDLMRLCSASKQSLRDELIKTVLSAIFRVRNECEEAGVHEKFVIIAPNTEDRVLETETSEKPQGIFQMIGNINEILSDSTQNDEENPFTSKLRSGAMSQGALDFNSPVSHTLGVITIPIFPCMTQVDVSEFQKKLEEDHKLSVVENNLMELGMASKFCKLALPYDWKSIWLTGKFSPEPLIKALSPISFWQTPLDQLEIEALVQILFSKAKVGTLSSRKSLDKKLSSEQAEDIQEGIPLPLPVFDSYPYINIEDLNKCTNLIHGTRLQKMEISNIFRVKSFFPYAPSTARASQSLLSLIEKRQNLSKHEQRILKQCLILPSSFSFKLIGGLERPKQVIHDLIQKPLQQPELFKKGILKQTATGLLLFGPPGTGKTLLARATASEANANFLSVQMSQIQSMWVGENEKNVQALFSLARKLKPCIIFIDEIDALLRTRSGGHRAQWSLNTLTEFMLEWDGIQSEANNGVIVMGSTNRPMDLDEAVLRRMPRRILVDLPDAQARKEILSILLREDPYDFDLDWLIQKTEVYSGSDLKNLCSAAALERLRHQSNVITKENFEEALRFVVPSTLKNSQLMKSLRDWDEIYGTRGLLMAGKGFGFV